MIDQVMFLFSFFSGYFFWLSHLASFLSPCLLSQILKLLSIPFSFLLNAFYF